MSQPFRCPECRYLLPGGQKCRGVAVKDMPYCLAHLRRSRLVDANRARRHSVALPPLEDWAAIQMSIDEILAAFAAHKITRRETGTYLYALQMASQILIRNERHAPPTDTPPITPTPIESTPQDPEPPNPDPADPDPADPDPAEPDSADPGPDTPGPTHELEPEPPLALTRNQIRQQRIQLELSLRNYYEARAYYSGNPTDIPGTDCSVVLAYLKDNIEQVEARLHDLNLQATPDAPPTRQGLARISHTVEVLVGRWA
jgi:hypothetical protein